MLTRPIFTDEHEQLRAAARRFFETEMVPYHRQWEKEGVAPRSIWKQAGAHGFLCVHVPTEYGGGGGDRIASAVLIEEQSRLGLSGPGFWAHSDIVAQYVVSYGTEAQKQAWLPQMASGDMIGAIVLTEPGTGSDLRSIRTTARRDGDSFIINGVKTFITNGQCADLLLVAVKTGDPNLRQDITLIAIQARSSGEHVSPKGRAPQQDDCPGLTRGPNIEKIGMKAQDTCELFFDEVHVPVTNVIGEENNAWAMLTHELAWERLQIAIGAMATSTAALDWTNTYTKDRKAFGTPIGSFQTPGSNWQR
jgi:alkylation response protein AidB-like acyl-CoA dehydrogenase